MSNITQSVPEKAAAGAQSSPDLFPDVTSVLNRLVPLKTGTTNNAPKFVTSAITTKVIIYHADHTISEGVRRMLMMALTLCGRSMDSSPNKWQTFVLSWSCLVFPELVANIRIADKANDYEFQVYPADFIEKVSAAVDAQGSEETIGDKFVIFPPHLPSAEDLPINIELLSSCLNLEGMYAYYSMMVFILGKSLSPEVKNSIGDKRPNALIRKRNLQSSEFILTGDGKISPENYGKVQSGWIRSTSPRIAVVTHLATLVSSPNRPEALDPIVVNMDMLADAGQGYIKMIHDLLTSCAFCLTIPILQVQFKYYTKLVYHLSSQPEFIQPYYKLMMQDSDKTFKRRDVEMLAAVAIYYVSQTKSTMKGHQVTRECIPVVRQFITMANARGMGLTDMTDQAFIESSAI